MQATYPAAQARVHSAHLCRTPIDAVTAVRSPGLQKGNSDLQPATWNPPAWLKPLISTAGPLVECSHCLGKGVQQQPVQGHALMCMRCMGTGRVES